MEPARFVTDTKGLTFASHADDVPVGYWRLRKKAELSRRFSWIMMDYLEVCGLWAGRKRLVAVCSGVRAVGGCRVVLVHWWTGKQGGGQMWTGDVGGDGRDAG